MHYVDLAGGAGVRLTKRTIWVLNVNPTGEIRATLTKCTPLPSGLPTSLPSRS